MKIIVIILLGFMIIISGCEMAEKNELNPASKVATFAGGCFWCMEAVFQETDGVLDVINGYSGGEKENPSYEEVTTGKTGHVEAIEIIYDPTKISFKYLVDLFWKSIDPTDDSGQFTDKGSQYKTTVFYRNEEEKKIAEESKQELENSGRFDKPIVTEILPFKNFFKAEKYHQDYYKKNSFRYKIYEEGSGRKQFVEEMWK